MTPDFRPGDEVRIRGTSRRAVVAPEALDPRGMDRDHEMILLYEEVEGDLRGGVRQMPACLLDNLSRTV